MKLLVHHQNPNNHQLSNQQQCLSLLLDKNQNNSILCSQNTIQNDVSITNNDNIQPCEAPRKQDYGIKTTSTPNHHSQCISTTSASILNLHTPTILPPIDKYYKCFQKDGKTSQATRCIKSRIMTKVIDYVSPL